MNTLLLLLLSRIAVGAAWFVVHLALLMRAAGAKQVSRWVRLLVIVPPLAPLVGLKLKARVLVYGWCVLCATYIALWYAS